MWRGALGRSLCPSNPRLARAALFFFVLHEFTTKKSIRDNLIENRCRPPGIGSYECCRVCVTVTVLFQVFLCWAALLPTLWGTRHGFPVVMPTHLEGLGYLLVLGMQSPCPFLFLLCLSEKDPRAVARIPSGSCWGQTGDAPARSVPGCSCRTLPVGLASSGPQFPHA